MSFPHLMIMRDYIKIVKSASEITSSIVYILSFRSMIKLKIWRNYDSFKMWLRF